LPFSLGLRKTIAAAPPVSIAVRRKNSASLDKTQPQAPLPAAIGGHGIPMKKIYEKPTLNRRQQLSRVTALIIPSDH
jgi:hypothetical protein